MKAPKKSLFIICLNRFFRPGNRLQMQRSLQWQREDPRRSSRRDSCSLDTGGSPGSNNKQGKPKVSEYVFEVIGIRSMNVILDTIKAVNRRNEAIKFSVPPIRRSLLSNLNISILNAIIINMTNEPENKLCRVSKQKTNRTYLWYQTGQQGRSAENLHQDHPPWNRNLNP